MRNTDLGEKIRSLRKERNYSREYFAEMIGISVSHLEKIENGDRRPGIGTFLKMLDVLEAHIEVNDSRDVVGQCINKMKHIFFESTEEQAVFMLKVMECMAEYMHILMGSENNRK